MSFQHMEDWQSVIGFAHLSISIKEPDVAICGSLAISLSGQKRVGRIRQTHNSHCTIPTYVGSLEESLFGF